MPCLFPLITDHHWLWVYTFCFVFAAAVDKASPSTFCLSQQPSLHIQPQRVCIYGVNCTTGPCTAAFLLHPWELHRTNSNSPSTGCWKPGVISARAPNQGQNSWLAQRISTSSLPSQLETPIDSFQRRECCWGNVGVGGGSLSKQRKA